MTDPYECRACGTTQPDGVPAPACPKCGRRMERTGILKQESRNEMSVINWQEVAQRIDGILGSVREIPAPDGWDKIVWTENYPPRIIVELGKLNTDRRRAENIKGYVCELTDSELAEITPAITKIAELGLNGYKRCLTEKGFIRYQFWFKIPA